MKKHKFLRIFLLILIVLTMLFIWSNSLWGREHSAQQSGRVVAFLQTLLGVRFSEIWIRKTAHFLEFFLLGAEITLYSVYDRTLVRRDVGNMLAVLFGTAFLDETLQIFSGRGPAIADVWLDAAGGVTAMLLVFALHFLLSACRRGRSRR